MDTFRMRAPTTLPKLVLLMLLFYYNWQCFSVIVLVEDRSVHFTAGSYCRLLPSGLDTVPNKWFDSRRLIVTSVGG